MTQVAKILGIAVAFLTCACVALTYLWIDRSISLVYSSQGYDSVNRLVNRLERVLENDWKGLSEAEVLKRLQSTFPQGSPTEAVVEKQDSVIWLDEIKFEFANGRLESIGNQ